MIRTILFSVLFLFSSTSLADAISITIKPEKRITGTFSLNIHKDDSVTLLVYEKPGKITERIIEVNQNELSSLKKLARQVLDEIIVKNDFSAFPEKDGSLSIAISKQKVTKSVTTRRYTLKLRELEDKVRYLSEKGRTEQ